VRCAAPWTDCCDKLRCMKSPIAALISVILLSLLLIGGVCAQPTTVDTIGGIRDNVNVVKTNVAHVKNIEPWLLFCAVLSIVLGLVTAILGAFDGSAAKKATVIVGAVIASVGALKASVFRIDYSTCDSVLTEVNSVVQLMDSEIKQYDQNLPDQDQTFKLLQVHEVQLENYAKILKESGQPILPLSFMLVAYAQGQPSQQSARANYSIQQTGTAVANNRKAAYQYAKFRALEALALSAAPGLSGSGLNSAIDYFSRFGDTAGSTCNQGQDKQTLCQANLSVSSTYLRADVINRFVNWAAKPPEVQLRGSAALRPDQSSVVVTVDEAGKPVHGSGKFQFTFGASTSGKVTELRLKEIQCSQDGRWIFEVTAGRQTLVLPLNQYDDGSHPTVYSVWNDNRTLHYPAESGEVAVTIAGYGPSASVVK